MSARSWFRKWHKWPSIFLSVFIMFFALSGVVLNHRTFFSSFDVSRKLLPPEYTYKNWNLAAIKSGIRIGADSILVYGNIGVWLTNCNYSTFTGFNNGFPEGSDNRKIYSLLKSSDGSLYAGTLMGLFKYNKSHSKWIKIVLPVSEERINRVLEIDNRLIVQTRSFLLYGMNDTAELTFSIMKIPAAVNDSGKVGLFRTLWVIHSGEIYGQIGKLFIDFIGLIFVFLTITGIIHWLSPKILKKINAEIQRHNLKLTNRWAIRWHNITGSWLIFILLLTTLTGMFLRPPLLIAIANSNVAKINFSILDNPNPWFDKFRDILYDTRNSRFLISTSDGMYYSDDQFNSCLKPFQVQPPLSVMGITHFDTVGSSAYLVSSFSGLFRWDPESGTIDDYLTGSRWVPKSGRDAVVGSVAVTGCIAVDKDQMLVFDFAKGAITAVNNSDAPRLTRIVKMPAMPPTIVLSSPMSLWNVALEFHTCRIWDSIIGEFYILLIPLLGLGIVFTLITGFFSWYIGKEVKRKNSA